LIINILTTLLQFSVLKTLLNVACGMWQNWVFVYYFTVLGSLHFVLFLIGLTIESLEKVKCSLEIEQSKVFVV
jgi:hypothetical protein